MIILVVLSMRMKIDKPRRNHHPFHIDDSPSLKRRRGNSFDPLPANPDISNGIKPGLRIHHAPIRQHRVVSLPA